MLPQFGYSPWSERKNTITPICNGWIDDMPDLNFTRKRSNSNSVRDNLNDRFIPNKICPSFYSLLVKEQKEKQFNNMSKSQAGTSNNIGGNSNANDLNELSQQTTSTMTDLNETLREESSINYYTSLLKQNIIQNNCEENIQPDNYQQELKPDKTFTKGKLFKFKRLNKRNTDMILNYSPFHLQQANQTPQEWQIRKIAKHPYKILDAPHLKDDFYFNLLDWSNKNMISIGLENAVYTWNAKTNEAFKLAELASHQMITSLNWSPRGILLGLGDENGDIRIFDTEKNKQLRFLEHHSYRVGTLSWNGNLLASGSRDTKICISDIRVNKSKVAQFLSHKQEVCGLKWSFDESNLASGGNDNKVFVWNLKLQKEIAKLSDHTAAVKALSWSPHNHNILATGGGTTDKKLKIWNINTMKAINSIDTGSQICNMEFSKNSNELVTTHGFSMNQVAVWQCHNMQNINRIATLYGHTYRVLYLAISPCGENIVTGSGDETLRFWKIFPSKKHFSGDSYDKSMLDPLSFDLR